MEIKRKGSPSKKRATHEKSSNVRDLSDSLLAAEILTRLPVKSVFIFKCVSKHWRLAISDPSFYRYYRSRNPLALQPNSSTFLKSLSSLMTSDKVNLSIVAVSKDLLLCVPERYEDPFHTSMATVDKSCCYCIFHPVTKQCVELPRPACALSFVKEGFHARVEDGVATSYTVVLLALHLQGGSTSVHDLEVFTSGTGEWRKIKVRSSQPFEFGYPRCVELNGTFYWYKRNYSPVDILLAYSPVDILLAYNPYENSDNFRLLEFPEGGGVRFCDVVQGRLTCYSSKKLGDYHNNFKVWTLDDHEMGKWHLEHDFSLDTRRHDHNYNFWDRPASLDPLDPDIAYFGGFSFVVSLNFRTKQVSRINQLLRFEIPFVPLPWPTAIPESSWKATQR